MKQEKFNIKTLQKRRNLCIFINFKCNVRTDGITRFFNFLCFYSIYACFIIQICKFYYTNIHVFYIGIIFIKLVLPNQLNLIFIYIFMYFSYKQYDKLTNNSDTKMY